MFYISTFYCLLKLYHIYICLTYYIHQPLSHQYFQYYVQNMGTMFVHNMSYICTGPSWTFSLNSSRHSCNVLPYLLLGYFSINCSTIFTLLLFYLIESALNSRKDPLSSPWLFLTVLNSRITTPLSIWLCLSVLNSRMITALFSPWICLSIINTS